MSARWLACVAVTCALGCAPSPTEIILSFDSDLRVPTEIDRVAVNVRRGGEADTNSVALLGADESPLPRTLVLRHEGGPLGPVAVRAEARLGDAVMVHRDLELSFVSGRSERLLIRLDAACAGVDCDAGMTCSAGNCRPIEVRDCELLLEPCDSDAGPNDAGPNDAGPNDAGPRDGGPDADAGPVCPLSAGLCAVPATVVRGERLAPLPCAGADAGVSWSLTGPGGTTTAAGDAPSFPIDQAGDYTLDATVAGFAGCDASATFSTAVATSTPVGAIGDAIRWIASRPGMVFLATNDGPWAVTTGGALRDLRVDSSGPAPPAGLRTVEVVSGRAYFGAGTTQDDLTEVVTDDAFASTVFRAIPLPAGDRATVTMATRVGEFDGPLVVGTPDGPVIFEGLPGATTSRALTPAWDPNRDIALAHMTTAGIGTLWGAKSRHIRNFGPFGEPALFASGSEVELTSGATTIRGLLIDDRDPGHRRLWMCHESGGILIFDLGADWTGLSTLPAPVVTIPGFCTDLAADDRGHVWAGTDTGLVRYDSDGVELARLTMTDDGVPAEWTFHVHATWNDTTREIWFVTGSDPGAVATAVHRFSVPRD